MTTITAELAELAEKKHDSAGSAVIGVEL